jgi:hypothetical protein
VRWSLRKKLSAHVELSPRAGDHGPKQFRFSPYLPDDFFRLLAGTAVILVHDGLLTPAGIIARI